VYPDISPQNFYAAELPRTVRIMGWVVDFARPLLSKAQLRCFPGKSGIAGKPAFNLSAYDGFVAFATRIIIKKFR